jgi:general L-amino acid transport system permease protein
MTIDQRKIAPEAPPEIPRLHPVRWAKENLLSSVPNAILTVVFVVGGLLALRGLLGFMFAPERKWSSIATNAKFYVVLAYPADSLHRVWISLGIIVVLAGISVVAWGTRPRMAPTKVIRAVMVLGVALAAVAALAPWSAGATVTGLVIGVVLAVAASITRRALGPAAYEPRIGVMGMVAALIILGVAALWILPAAIDPIEIANSTKGPLTIEAAVGLLSYWAGLRLARVIRRQRLQQILVSLWLLSLPLIYLVVLRAPRFDTELILRQDLPIAGFFLAVGSAILWYVSAPERKGVTTLVGGIVFVLALAVWFPPLSSVVPLIKARAALLLLALFIFAASTFGGDKRARRILVVAWIVTESVVAFFIAVGQAELGLNLQTHYLGGLLLTLVLAFAGLLLAFPMGVLLALGRTSTMPIFRMLSIGYIEVIRGVPLITILFFGALFLPLFLPSDIRVDVVLRAVIAIALFSAAYLAENVRGGLQSIPKGQYEAARAVGMTTAQLTIFITLPQALRAVIPALVGQVISLFKDTSLVFIIGLSEILLIAARLVPGQPEFIGSQRENLLFVAFVFWIFTFTFSRASQRLERKLGVGER